jgi:IclR family acetate operon transcriptional repressor
MAMSRNKSVARAFAILNSFGSSNEWISCQELSRRAKLSNASGHRLVTTLVEIGAVVRGVGGRYRAGMLLVSLARNVAITEVLREASEDIIFELANRANATVHLGILEKGMVTYVTKASTPTSLLTHARPGAQLEGYSSGLGKVLLAGLPRRELESILFDGELVPLTPYTIIDRKELVRQLNRVRTLGFAVDDRETRDDLCCVAVPVHDGDGRVVGALSASDRAQCMTPERQAELCVKLLETATVLGHKLYRFELPTSRDA